MINSATFKKILFLGLLAVGVQAHGAGFKSSLEAAKKSVSSIANTKLGKMFLKNKYTIIWAAEVTYMMYHLDDTLDNYVESPESHSGLITLTKALSYPIFWTYFVATGASDAQISLMGGLTCAGLHYYVLPKQRGMIFVRGMNSNNNHANNIQYIGNRRLPNNALAYGLYKAKDTQIIHELLARGAANSHAGQKVLLQAHPKVAQQYFAPRHQSLVTMLKHTRITKAGNIADGLPEGISSAIASFLTGITPVKAPMSSTAAKALANAEMVTSVQDLDTILDNAYNEWGIPDPQPAPVTTAVIPPTAAAATALSSDEKLKKINKIVDESLERLKE